MTEQEYNAWVIRLNSYKEELAHLESSEEPELTKDLIISIRIEISNIEYKISGYVNE